MTSTKIGEIGFQCKECGSTEFRYPDDATDSGVVSCNGCGQLIGTIAEIKAAAVEHARAVVPDIAKRFRDALKRR